ncbi:MAG: 16S rRNA processing protein RimM [Bacteroidetes bacterium]|nr:16S rRNA processing protein RimM [Bacteroidota bacterium]
MKSKIKTTAYCAIAKILKPFGIRGEVKIFSYARSAEEFRTLHSVYIGKSEHRLAFSKIETVSVRGNDIYVKLKDINDRTASEALSGNFLFVEATLRKELPAGSFFIDELLESRIVNEQGTELGILHSVEKIASQTMYIVTTKRGEVLLPAVKEFIVSIDGKKKIIIVRPPEGLFEGEML